MAARTAGSSGVNAPSSRAFPEMAARGQKLKAALCTGLTVFVMATVGTLLLIAVSRWVAVAGGLTRPEETDKGQ